MFQDAPISSDDRYELFDRLPEKRKLEENDFKTKPLRYIRPGKGVWRGGRGRGIWRTVFTRRLANYSRADRGGGGSGMVCELINTVQGVVS